MRTVIAGIVVSVTALAIVGCTNRVEYVEVAPECSLPPKPAELDARIEHDLEDGLILEAGTDIDPAMGDAFTLEEPHRLLAPGEAYAPEDLYWSIVDRDKALTDWSLEMKGVIEGVCEGGRKGPT